MRGTSSCSTTAPTRDAAGYEVLTPLHAPRRTTLLVDRGWVPFSGSRAQLPDVTLTRTAP